MYVQSLTRLLQQVWIICDITNHMEANPGPVISKLKLNVDTHTYSSDIVSNEALRSKWGHLFLVMIHFLSVSNSFLCCVYVENWWKKILPGKLSKFLNVNQVNRPSASGRWNITHLRWAAQKKISCQNCISLGFTRDKRKYPSWQKQQRK